MWPTNSNSTIRNAQGANSNSSSDRRSGSGIRGAQGQVSLAHAIGAIPGGVHPQAPGGPMHPVAALTSGGQSQQQPQQAPGDGESGVVRPQGPRVGDVRRRAAAINSGAGSQASTAAPTPTPTPRSGRSIAAAAAAVGAGGSQGAPSPVSASDLAARIQRAVTGSGTQAAGALASLGGIASAAAAVGARRAGSSAPTAAPSPVAAPVAPPTRDNVAAMAARLAGTGHMPGAQAGQGAGAAGGLSLPVPAAPPPPPGAPQAPVAGLPGMYQVPTMGQPIPGMPPVPVMHYGPAMPPLASGAPLNYVAGQQIYIAGQQAPGGPQVYVNGQLMAGTPQVYVAGQQAASGPQVYVNGQLVAGGPQVYVAGQQAAGGPQVHIAGAQSPRGTQVYVNGQPVALIPPQAPLTPVQGTLPGVLSPQALAAAHQNLADAYQNLAIAHGQIPAAQPFAAPPAAAGVQPQVVVTQPGSGRVTVSFRPRQQMVYQPQPMGAPQVPAPAAQPAPAPAPIPVPVQAPVIQAPVIQPAGAGAGGVSGAVGGAGLRADGTPWPSVPGMTGIVPALGTASTAAIANSMFSLLRDRTGQIHNANDFVPVVLGGTRTAWIIPPNHSAAQVWFNGVPEAVNANYVTPGPDDYHGNVIAAQGPLRHGPPEELSSFLAMTMDHNVDSIVDMDGRVEHRYWPSLGATRQVTLGDRTFNMTTQRVDQRNGFEIITTRLQEAGSGQEKTVRIYSFHQWPRQGVPTGAVAFRQYMDFTRAVNASSAQGNTVVHCDNGVGVTGTQIVLWQLMSGIHNGSVNRSNLLTSVMDSIWNGRIARGPSFVQTPEQVQLMLDVALAEIQRVEGYAGARADGAPQPPPRSGTPYQNFPAGGAGQPGPGAGQQPVAPQPQPAAPQPQPAAPQPQPQPAPPQPEDGEPVDGAWGGAAAAGFDDPTAPLGSQPLTFVAIMDLVLADRIVSPEDRRVLVSPEAWRVMISQLSTQDLYKLASVSIDLLAPLDSSRIPDELRRPVLDAYAEHVAPELLIEHRGFEAAINAVRGNSIYQYDPVMRNTVIRTLQDYQRDVENYDQRR